MWTKREKKLAIKLVDEDMLYREISAEFARKGYDKSPETIRAFLKNNKDDFDEKNARYKLDTEEEYDDGPRKTPRTPNKREKRMQEEAIERITRLRETLKETTTTKFQKIGKPTGKKRTKILSISDLHVPFDNEEVILHALEHHSDADILVVNGDILEMHAVSTWPRYKDIMLRWEYKMAMEWMKIFSETFPKVYLTAGNHEHRLKSYFAANIDPVASFLVSDDVLTKVAKGYDFVGDDDAFKRVHSFRNVHYSPGILNWYTKIGKCIFAHPRIFSSVPMKTVVNVANSFMDREDFQALVIGHTHKMGKLVWRDRLLIEQGCCCVPMDYEADGKCRYLPQAFGYAVVYLDAKGNVDFDQSAPVYRGTGYPVKSDLS